MRVDAHHHLWTADYPWLAAPGLEPLRRDYTVTDLRHALAGFRSATVSAIEPFVDTALDMFGPDRLMIGSDWPVCELVASYADTAAALDACLDGVVTARKRCRTRWYRDPYLRS